MYLVDCGCYVCYISDVQYSQHDLYRLGESMELCELHVLSPEIFPHVTSAMFTHSPLRLWCSFPVHLAIVYKKGVYYD